MSAAKALFARLTDPTAGAYALAGTRVYPDGAVPQAAALPLVVYDVAETDYPRTYQGHTCQADSTVDVTCVAATYAGAVALAAAVRDDLDNQSGAWGGVTVQGAFVTGAGESPTQITDRGVTRFEVDLTVRIWTVRT